MMMAILTTDVVHSFAVMAIAGLYTLVPYLCRFIFVFAATRECGFDLRWTKL